LIDPALPEITTASPLLHLSLGHDLGLSPRSIPRGISHAKKTPGKSRAPTPIDRAGALLKEFDARGGDRKSKKAPEGPYEKSQRQAAGEAGMSRKQQVQGRCRLWRFAVHQTEKLKTLDAPVFGK
jgi:hypothetical protein